MSRSRQARAKTAAGLQKLRKAGLIGPTEYRGKVGGGGYRLLNKYRDVIEGRAVAVKPSTKLIPKQVRAAYKGRKGKLVIPKVPGTVSTSVERIKSGDTWRVKVSRSRRVPERGIIREEVLDVSREWPPLKPGQMYRVTMPNWRDAYNFFDQDTLEEFMDHSANLRIWADVSVVDASELARVYHA